MCVVIRGGGGGGIVSLCGWAKTNIALFPEDRVAKKSLTRAAAKIFVLHTNGNPNEKRK